MKVKKGPKQSRRDQNWALGGLLPKVIRLRTSCNSLYVGTRKKSELCLSRAKPEETQVEARKFSDVQIDLLTWA